jgi:hypothetical protein
MAPPFLTSTPDRGKWTVSRPCPFTSGERASDTLWIGGWMSPRAGLETVRRRIFPCLEYNPGRPVRSPSLYRLSYPDYCSFY